MRAKKKRMKTNQKITQMTKSKTFLGANVYFKFGEFCNLSGS